MNARARVASGDGEPSLKVAGVKGGQLFLEGHDDETSIGAHVGNLRVELDVLYLKSKIKDIFSRLNSEGNLIFFLIFLLLFFF